MNKKLKQTIRHLVKMREVGACPVCEGTGTYPKGKWCVACDATGRKDVHDAKAARRQE